MSCDYRHCPPHLPTLPSSPAQIFHADLLASIVPPLHELGCIRAQCGVIQVVVGYVQVIASSIFVISWKCLVLGKPRARIPNACLDSWKCRSKFFLSQISVSRLATQASYDMKDTYRPIYTWSEQISHRY